MTRHDMTLCDGCGEGVYREDPQTGETRCGNCGNHPPILGGQGRDADEVASDALAAVGLLVAGAVIAVLAVVVSVL